MSPGFFKGRPWRQALLWLAGLAPFFYLSYGLANAWAIRQSAAGKVPTIVFEWERAIPFLDWTVFPYWSINFFYGLSLFLALNRHQLTRHAARLLTAQVVAVTCFLLWPLHFSFGQPPAEGVAAMLFAALRSFDQPFNQAPSLHIALAVILWDWYRLFLRQPWQRLVMHVWTLAIIVSVLTTFQHHFIDIPTGALLGLMCVWLWPLEREVPRWSTWRLTRDRRRLTLAAVYLGAGLLCFGLGLQWGGIWLWLTWPAVSLVLVAMNYLGFGARGFRMNRQGNLHGSMRWLLAPYLLGAKVNAWAWTRKLPPRVEVVPGVWLGRRPSTSEWLAAGQPRVVSLCAELALPPGMQTTARCLPLLDLVVPSPGRLLRAAHLVQAQRQAAEGGPVWVCCALGFTRSVAAVIAWQLMYGGQADLAKAVATTAKAKRQLVLGPEWLSALRSATYFNGRM
jgi:hypothetical protein